jgi:hypothetical protein
MPKTIHGRAHGKTIELDEDLGVPDGQEVRVTVEPLPPEAGQQCETASGPAWRLRSRRDCDNFRFIRPGARGRVVPVPSPVGGPAPCSGKPSSSGWSAAGWSGG